MARLSRPLVAVLAILGACAPAAPPPKSIEAAKPTKGPAPTWPRPARWALTPPRSLWAHAVSIGEAKLWIGGDGERWLATKGQPPVGATEVLPETIAGSTGTVSVGLSGTAYVTKTPLGEVVETRPPPHAVRRAAAGRAAILLVTVDGRLLRSVDGGATYTERKLPTMGRASAIAMSGEHGLLVTMPQALFVTHDDGATFVALPTSGTGALEPYTGADGSLSIVGGPGAYASAATLRDGALVPAYKSPDATVGWPSRAVRAQAAADKYAYSVVEAEGQDKPGVYELLVDDVAPTYVVPPPRRQYPLPLLEGCIDVIAGAREETVVLGCVMLSAKAVAKRQLRLFRSEDAGKSFVDDGLVAEAPQRVVLGPNGLLLLPCSRDVSALHKPCEESWVRPPGAKELRALPMVEGATVDATGSLILVRRGSLGDLEVSRQAPNDEKPALLGRIEKVPDVDAVNVFVSGSALLVAVTHAKRLYAHTSTDGGATFVEHTLDGVSVVRGSGRRLLVTGIRAAFESADGGLTFVQVTRPNGAEPTACAAWGCATTRGLRIGWNQEGAAPPPAEPSPLPKRWATPLRCTPTSEWQPAGLGVLPTIDAVEPSKTLRLAWPRRRTDDGYDLVLVDRAGKTQVLPLLGAAPKGLDDRSQTFAFTQPTGVVVGRYRYKRKGGGTLSPVDVDLAWYAFDVGKVRRVTKAALAIWRVTHDPQSPSNQPNVGVVRLDGDRVWFHPPTESSSLHRFDADGKVTQHGTTLPLAPELEVRTVGASTFAFRPFFTLRDAIGVEVWPVPSKELAPRRWVVWDRGGSDVKLAAIAAADRPAIQLTFPGDAQSAPFEVGIPLADAADPPAFATLPRVVADPPPTCANADGARSLSFGLVGTRHPVQISPIVLATDGTVVRTAGDKTCVAAWVATQPGNRAEHVAVIRPDALDDATLYRVVTTVWPRRLETRSLTCAFAPGPLPAALADEPGF